VYQVARVEDPISVLVTETEFMKGKAVFTSTAGVNCVAVADAEEDAAQAVRRMGARYIIVGPIPYLGDALYAALSAGGVVARFGAGHDGIDKSKATRAGVLCTNTPGVLHQSVAEFAILLILAAARHLVPLASETIDRRWRPLAATELQGKKLAVIGRGHIGRLVAQIASGGFRMTVNCAERAGDYLSAVHDADFVSIHIPATAANTHFINRERLASLQEHAWLINTSRGIVVDEAALYDALAARRIAGAAIDVFQREPYEPADPARDLRTLPNVILTPHVGSNTLEANHRMAERALRNILLANAGDFASMDLLNPEVLSK
jgi:phosphoglycerate dehydrogenase-like enzyme